MTYILVALHPLTKLPVTRDGIVCPHSPLQELDVERTLPKTNLTSKADSGAENNNFKLYAATRPNCAREEGPGALCTPTDTYLPLGCPKLVP